MVDIDLGEMFINFPAHTKLRKVSGIDLSPFREQIRKHFPEHITAENQKLIYGWNRTWMGLKPSPYYAARYFYVMEEFIIGNPKDPNHVFRWDEVWLNLPGSESFNPSLPFVIKWDSVNERIAAALKAYVDDLRVAAVNIDVAWKGARQTASRIEYLGSQDAPRKRRVDKGPWAGTIFNTENGTITITVTQLKWDKAKRLVKELLAEFQTDSIDDIKLDYKRLEQVRGFLCHLALTYSLIFPYLKGFHLTLSSHLKNRNEDGWKLSDMDYIAYLEEKHERDQLSIEEKEKLFRAMSDANPKPPKFIRPAPLFLKCLKALDLFFSAETPPFVHVRSEKVFMAVYGFIDASGSGFGSSFDRESKTSYRMGVWGKDDEGNSSNWKEFQNFVESQEYEYTQGTLEGALLILAVDNSTVESCIYKGNSTSPKLYDLILRFKRLEMNSGARFIVSHVSRNRMKRRGTDGISRGSFKEGITLGESMLSFCPWHLSSLEQNKLLKDWVKTWTGPNVEFLSPSDWFTRGHDWNGYYKDDLGFWRQSVKSGNFIWTPPPAADHISLEELRKARIKRQDSSHVFLIPKLMTQLWLKQFYKAMDIVFFVSPVHTFWGPNNFESLAIGICFPYARYEPCQAKGSPKVYRMAGDLHRLFKQPDVVGRDLLRKLFLLLKRLPTMSEHVVRKVLHFSREAAIPTDVSGPSRSSSRKRKEAPFSEGMEETTSKTRRIPPRS